MSVSPDEKLTRFICSRGDFAREKGIVKFRAFMPPHDRENPTEYSPDLSVYRVSGLSESESWEIGWKYVQTPGRSIKARADLLTGNVYDNNLKVIPDPRPHKRHANITPFPAGRLACQVIATKLARRSKLVVVPPE